MSGSPRRLRDDPMFRLQMMVVISAVAGAIPLYAGLLLILWSSPVLGAAVTVFGFGAMIHGPVCLTSGWNVPGAGFWRRRIPRGGA